MELGSRGCSTGGGEESELGGASFHLQLLVCQLDDMVVYDQDGGTPLDSDLDQGAGEEANSPAGGARGVGGVVVGGVSIFTRKFEEGNRSLFLGGSFVQCDDIPLIMAGGKIQSRK